MADTALGLGNMSAPGSCTVADMDRVRGADIDMDGRLMCMGRGTEIVRGEGTDKVRSSSQESNMIGYRDS